MQALAGIPFDVRRASVMLIVPLHAVHPLHDVDVVLFATSCEFVVPCAGCRAACAVQLLCTAVVYRVVCAVRSVLHPAVMSACNAL